MIGWMIWGKGIQFSWGEADIQGIIIIEVILELRLLLLRLLRDEDGLRMRILGVKMMLISGLIKEFFTLAVTLLFAV